MEHLYLDLFKAAKQALEHSAVKPSETVIVLTDPGKNPAVADAFYTAGVAIGAETILVSMPTRPTILIDPPEPLVRAMIEADIVVDAVSQPWPYTRAMQRICESGTRVLQVLVPEPGIIARPPDAEVVARAKRAREVLGDFKTFRITSDLGTDVTFTRASGRPVHAQDGAASQPGEWDSVGTGFAVISPVETEGDGVVVVYGTAFLPMEELYVADEPFELEIQAGRLVNIKGDGKVARRVDEWLRAWDDPNSYVIAHTGFGIDPRAKLEPPDPGAWESLIASVNVAFGSNTVPSLGGENLSKSHIDFVLFDASVEIDGVKIIDRGQFTPAFEITNKR